MARMKVEATATTSYGERLYNVYTYSGWSGWDFTTCIWAKDLEDAKAKAIKSTESLEFEA